MSIIPENETMVDTVSLPAEDLLRVVYHELHKLAERRLAGERADHTLQATALVHEVYLKLFGGRQRQWHSTDQFFAAAAESMRHILVDSARTKRAQKRSFTREIVSLDEVSQKTSFLSPQTILEIDDLLSQLSAVDAEAAELIQLRIFAGLSVSDAGKVLNLPRSTAYEVWSFARAWFAAHFEPGSS